MRELYGRGYGEELQWLEVYLAEEARDRTLDGTCMHMPCIMYLSTVYWSVAMVTDEWEEMSVVAVSSKVIQAMETDIFKQLLGHLGLHPPSSPVRALCKKCACVWSTIWRVCSVSRSPTGEFPPACPHSS